MYEGEGNLDARLTQEIIYYLEDKVVHDTATEEELELYIDYKNEEKLFFDKYSIEVIETLIEEIERIAVDGY